MQPLFYRAPSWLPGGHLQTIWAALFAPTPRVAYRRCRLILPDGDFLDLDYTAGNPEDTPLVVLFHGLEGSSQSHYALALMHAVRAHGWQGVVVHFRGCSGEPNRLPRAYHSGDSAEIASVVFRLRREHPGRKIFAVGVSLGGNALLKFLGEQGKEARALIGAAAAVSAPVDLAACGRHLDRGLNRLLYTRHFLASLKAKALAKADAHHLPLDVAAVRKARTLFRFDDLFTAPLHGFRDAQDYWTRAAARPWLNSIAVPTLLINAKNDPFLPARFLPRPEEVSPWVRLDYPAQGGHVGFVSGPFPGRLDWLPARLLAFFEQIPPRAADGRPSLVQPLLTETP